MVGTDGGGVGFSKGRGFAASFSSYNPQTPFKGGFGRFAPSRGIAEWSAIFYYKPSGIFSGRLFFVYIFGYLGLWLSRSGLINGSTLNRL